MKIQGSKSKFEIADHRGNWERVRKGAVSADGWLHYTLADGTIGLKGPGQWRVEPSDDMTATTKREFY